MSLSDMRPELPSGDASPKARAAPTQARYTAQAGVVLDRGSPMHPAFVPVLLDAYRHSAAAGDWWAPEAKRLADELQAAVRQAETLEHRSAV